MIRYFVAQLLLNLVRMLFGLFIGGFLGASIGVIIELMAWLEKGGNQTSMENLTVSTIFGASVGALVGLTNLLGRQNHSKKLPQDEKKDASQK